MSGNANSCAAAASGSSSHEAARGADEPKDPNAGTAVHEVGLVEGLANTEENAVAISIQTRRRLLGFTGGDEDLDMADWRFPQVVLVSPVSLVNLLADELDLPDEKKVDEETAESLHYKGDLQIGGVPGKYAFDGMVDEVTNWRKVPL